MITGSVGIDTYRVHLNHDEKYSIMVFVGKGSSQPPAKPFARFTASFPVMHVETRLSVRTYFTEYRFVPQALGAGGTPFSLAALSGSKPSDCLLIIIHFCSRLWHAWCRRRDYLSGSGRSCPSGGWSYPCGRQSYPIGGWSCRGGGRSYPRRACCCSGTRLSCAILTIVTGGGRGWSYPAILVGAYNSISVHAPLCWLGFCDRLCDRQQNIVREIIWEKLQSQTVTRVLVNAKTRLLVKRLWLSRVVIFINCFMLGLTW